MLIELNNLVYLNVCIEATCWKANLEVILPNFYTPLGRDDGWLHDDWLHDVLLRLL